MLLNKVNAIGLIYFCCFNIPYRQNDNMKKIVFRFSILKLNKYKKYPSENEENTARLPTQG